MSSQDTDLLKSNFNDILARLRALEQSDRKYAEEIFNLHRENSQLEKKLNIMEIQYESLSKMMVQMGLTEKINNIDFSDVQREHSQLKKATSSNKKMIQELERKLSRCDQQMQTLSMTHEDIAQLEKTRIVLNRALVQSHNTGRLQTIESNVRTLSNWKDTKRKMDNTKFKSLDDQIHDLNTAMSDLQESLKSTERKLQDNQSHGRAIDSIICARLQRQLFEEGVTWKKLRTFCSKQFTMGNALSFDTGSGILTTREDGVYCLCWMFVQNNSGTIRYYMHIDETTFYLGCTKEGGDMCSGSVIIPLKSDQKVWLVVMRKTESECRILMGNWMAYQITRHSLGTTQDVAFLQEELLSTGNAQCQHL